MFLTFKYCEPYEIVLFKEKSAYSYRKRVRIAINVENIIAPSEPLVNYVTNQIKDLNITKI